MNLKQKLTSRKFWMALITLISGVLGMLGADDNVVQIIASGALTLIPTVIYILTEGKIDAASVGSAVTTVGGTITEVADALKDKSQNIEPDVDEEMLTE